MALWLVCRERPDHAVDENRGAELLGLDAGVGAPYCSGWEWTNSSRAQRTFGPG